MNLSRWMTDKVWLSICTGVNTSGDPTYGPLHQIYAYVMYGDTTVRTASGEETKSDARIATHTVVTQYDRVWLPGANTTNANDARRPISIACGTLPGTSQILYEVSL